MLRRTGIRLRCMVGNPLTPSEFSGISKNRVAGIDNNKQGEQRTWELYTQKGRG